MIDTLRDAEVREEARAILPLLDHLRSAGCRQDAPSAGATENLLHVLVADELWRDVLPDGCPLAGTQRRQLRPSAGGALALRVRHPVFRRHNWGFEPRLGARSARRLALLGSRRLGSDGPGELAALAPPPVHLLPQLRVLVLDFLDARSQLLQERQQRALVVWVGHLHRGGLITPRCFCRSPWRVASNVRDDGRSGRCRPGTSRVARAPSPPVSAGGPPVAVGTAPSRGASCRARSRS